MLRTILIVSLSATAFAPAAWAEDTKPKRKAPDPNQVICEKQEVLGSRLATRKVCMTRSEWAEQKRLQRETVERSQVGACAPGPGRC